jgi:hypothetical protein
MPSMLERIRRNRRLGSLVLAVFTMLWLVALLAGVRVRTVDLPSQAAALAMQQDICTTAVNAQPWTAQLADATAANDSSHGSHHGPDCLLCIALSPPPQLLVQVYRPPAPIQARVWLAPAHFPPSWQATAPLPPRGPPLTFQV